MGLLSWLPFVHAQNKPTLCQQLEPLLAEGDLVFLDIDFLLFKKVAEATLTWTSHVGIALKDENDEWIVAESTTPLSKKSKFCDFIARTDSNHVAIRRLNHNFTADEITRIKEAVDERMGVFYDLGFNYDSKRLFCSKLVYQVFLQALSVEVGDLQTMRELLDENPDGDVGFWRWWYLGRIPWERRTVTPKSQLVDKKFRTVWTWERQQSEENLVIAQPQKAL